MHITPPVPFPPHPSPPLPTCPTSPSPTPLPFHPHPHSLPSPSPCNGGPGVIPGNVFEFCQFESLPNDRAVLIIFYH